MINNNILFEYMNIIVKEPFELSILGLITFKYNKPVLSYLEKIKFIPELEKNKNIKALFVKKELMDRINLNGLILIPVKDPAYTFFTLMNKITINQSIKIKSKIHPSAQIDPSAYVSKTNVRIGKNVVIMPNVTIMGDVEIDDDTIIQPGVVIGSDGFEYKRTSMGILRVLHDSKVLIGKNVVIGANTCIDKGIFKKETVIGDNVKVDNLCYIAHSVQIGKGVFIAASAMIAGNVKIGMNTWIGPNANIIPQITVGDEAFVSLGSVVTKSVQKKEWVTGNFAIPHSEFIKKLKSKQ